jgi:hypothetical protein
VQEFPEAPSASPLLQLESTDSFISRWDGSTTIDRPAMTAGRKSGVPEYSETDQSHVLRFYPGSAQPGALRTLRHIYGVVNDSLVFGEISQSWAYDGVTSVYVYNKDGLYAGQILEMPADQSTPSTRYSLSAEAITGAINQDASGNVYFFGDWVNEARAYKISGWTGWTTATGQVTVPNAYTAPAFLAESTGPISTGTGLTGRYYTNDHFGGAPAFTRVDPKINFRWTAEVPLPTGYAHSPTGVDPFSVRWTGTLTPRRSGWHMFRQKYTNELQSRYLVNGAEFRWSLDTAAGFHFAAHTGFSDGPSRAVYLQAGVRYPVQLDFVGSGTGEHAILIEWSEPETNAVFVPVPTSQLFP